MNTLRNDSVGFRRQWLVLVLGCVLVCGSRAEAQQKPQVVGSHAQLRALGLEVGEGFGPESGAKQLSNTCPRFGGDGMYNLSFSNEFMARYTARGFTKLALCAAVASGIRYDPETGRPLRSVILADFDKVRRHQEEAGTVTDPLPLEIPDCFKRARPLADCDVRYDMLTGKRVSSRDVQRMARTPDEGEGGIIAIKLSGGGYVLYNDGAAGPEPDEDILRLVRSIVSRSPDIRTSPGNR